MFGLRLKRKRASASTGAGDHRYRHRGRWRGMLRAYKAAKRDRLTADWLSSGADINHELAGQLGIIRMRARELEQNSDLARSFLGLCETHIVGHEGFKLFVQGKHANGKLDTRANKRIEREFRQWSRRGVCELTGRFSLVDCEQLLVRTVARDGECLVRLHDIQPTKKNPWGFVIELLDPARLDHTYSDDLRNGNRIRLGIELNPAGRAVAYWLKRGERVGLLACRDEYERVPAEDIIHWYESDRPEQLRAITWMASGMLTVHQLDAYQEAAVVAARSGASKMGFYTAPEGNKHAVADDEDEDGFIEEFEPGHMGQLPPGWGFEGFDPKYPHENYDPFMVTNQRAVAMGWGVSYHALTGDLTDVNFSSIRSGTLEERERWKVKQRRFSSSVLERIYVRHLEASVFNGRLGNSVSQETFIERFSEHRWQGRRWGWVDPKKDIEAIVMAINAGFTSPQIVAAELGVDIEVILKHIAEFQGMVESNGVKFPVVKFEVPGANKKRGGELGDERVGEAA